MKKYALIIGLALLAGVGIAFASIEAIKEVNIRAAERGYNLANENLYNHNDSIVKLKDQIKQEESQTLEIEKELSDSFCDLGKIKDFYEIPFSSDEVQKKYLNDCLGLHMEN
tara:strand:- start:20 stop:355 length:336 start_codon:yes stop_codon:yes gene_type:complete